MKPAVDGRATRTTICTVTLHAVIDDTFVVPGFEPGATQRAANFISYPVGKGVSCATALRTLLGTEALGEVAVVVLCGVSDVDLYKQRLGSMGFGTVEVHGGPLQTRRHCTVIDPKGGIGVTHLQVPGILHPAKCFKADAAVRVAVRRAAADGAFVVLSGSLPLGAPADTYEVLCREIRQAGGIPCVDTSGPALKAALQAAPYMIKPNRAEAEKLVGRELPSLAMQLAAAKEIRGSYHVEWVLLSDAADGLVVVGPGGACHAFAELSRLPFSVENDQGCGDTVVASFVARLVDARHADEKVNTMSFTRKLARAAVIAATANLFSQIPGELLPHHFTNDSIQNIVVVKEI